ATARDGQNAFFRVRVEPAEEAREIRRRADKASRRRQRVRRVIAGNDEAPAERQLRTMTARHQRIGGDRHVGLGLVKPGSFDDLALDPIAVALAGDRLDNEAGATAAVIWEFEPRVGRDRRALPALSRA